MDASTAALRAEGEDLDALVAGLPPEAWRTPTPAAGWTIGHQVGHLQWTDERALVAVTDPPAFAAALAASAEQGPGLVDEEAAARAAWPPQTLLGRWRTGRERLADALDATPDDVRIPWFGPPMRRRSMIAARLMETWVHGHDVAEALGVVRPATDRLFAVADLGVRTRDFAHRINGLEPPPGPFRVELESPGGDTWVWGPEAADERVTGPAEGFCLVVAQRLDPPAAGVVAHGDAATRWLSIAQVFAGPPRSARARGTVEP